MRIATFISVATFTLIVLAEKSSACNEAVCAPIVSKCILLRACGCDMTDKANCSCCKDCSVCLSNLYVECCSCVGMCPEPRLDDSIFRTSSIEDLPNPLPELFNVLTDSNSPYSEWSVHSYPTYKGLLKFNAEGKMNIDISDPEFQKYQHGFPPEAFKNCSVAFMASCMPLRKCKSGCKSMGATKMRWFHQYGCCQCIGSTCFDYGLDEARCANCPAKEDRLDAQIHGGPDVKYMAEMNKEVVEEELDDGILKNDLEF
ncbi:twisted gastrulation protein homolog 1-A-like [Tubulanus polymorphus]|uniref:twisted gastrulation protein homolog 1-A-like n=1 Tax=Tubulanus polymorphus TaxID=672921 RepID=UPI003DA5AB7B